MSIKSIDQARAKESLLQHQELVSLVEFHPLTGEMSWIRKRRGQPPVGTKCGRIAIQKHGQKYIQVQINRRFYYLHRLIWLYVYGKWPEGIIDHIDGDGLNNRVENLRDVSVQENARNQKRYSTNTSGYAGVYWLKDTKKWRCSIVISGKSIIIGNFERFDDACQARDEAKIKYGFSLNHGKNKDGAWT